MAVTPENKAKPLLIVIGGMSGTGKTTLADTLKEGLPNVLHLDADRITKGILGVPESTFLPDEVYRDRDINITGRMIAEMEKRTREGLAAGKTVIVTSVLLSPKARQNQEHLARETGAQFVGLWLHVNPQTETGLRTLFQRVSTHRTDDNPSDAYPEIVQRQARRYERPRGNDWRVIEASQAKDKVVNDALNIILRRIGNAPRPQPQPRPR